MPLKHLVSFYVGKEKWLPLLYSFNYICDMVMRLILILALVFSVSKSFAQDYIIRIYGDTIFCKVDSRDERFVYYVLPKTHKGSREVMSVKEVEKIVYDANPQFGKDLSAKLLQKEFETFQFKILGGYSHILDTDEFFGEDFEDYYKELQSGYFYELGANYFFNSENGVGLLYSRNEYSSKNRIPVEFDNGSGNILQGFLYSNRTVHYVAGNFSYRISDRVSSYSLQLNIGIGVTMYRENLELISPVQLSSNVLGGHVEGEFHLSLGGGFYLPVSVSLKGFDLYGLNVETSDEIDEDLKNNLELIFNNSETRISLNRIEIMSGLLFAF